VANKCRHDLVGLSLGGVGADGPYIRVRQVDERWDEAAYVMPGQKLGNTYVHKIKALFWNAGIGEATSSVLKLRKQSQITKNDSKTLNE